MLGLAVMVLLVGACTVSSKDPSRTSGSPLDVVPGSRTTVVEAGTAGYAMFRIPVLVRAPNGDLLLFGEARRTASDFGNIDVVQFRSTDRGRTWSGPVVVADNGSDTAADMAAVVKADEVHLLYQQRPGNRDFGDYLKRGASDARGLHIVSDDNGQTWSAPDTITSQVLPEADEQLPMFGPNNGIVLDSGRLVAPMYYANQSTETFTPAVIYSDDGGTTWTRSEDAVTGESVNETAVVQVPNGDLFAVARDDSGDDNDQKRFFRSTNRGSTWVETGDLHPAIPAVSCQQSMRARGNRLFLAGPTKRSRRDGRLWTGTYAPDRSGGVDWRAEGLQVTRGGFAYSAMVIQDSTHHLVYEDNVDGTYEALRYVRVRGAVSPSARNGDSTGRSRAPLSNEGGRFSSVRPISRSGAGR